MTTEETLRAMDAHLAALDLLVSRLLADAARRDPEGEIAQIVDRPGLFVLGADTLKVEGDARVLMQGTLSRLLENASFLRQHPG